MRFSYAPVTDAAQADYLSREEVRQFFIRRFQENPYTQSLLPGVYEFSNNGNGGIGPCRIRSVRYWNVMMKIAANILGRKIDKKRRMLRYGGRYAAISSVWRWFHSNPQ